MCLFSKINTCRLVCALNKKMIIVIIDIIGAISASALGALLVKVDSNLARGALISDENERAMRRE